jgi:cytochrome o ubiquinol oxidase subunit 2
VRELSRWGRRALSYATPSRSKALTLVILCGVLASCKWATLETRGLAGEAERLILSDARAIMPNMIALAVFLVLVFALWWSWAGRQREHDRLEWEFSIARKRIVWSIPAVVVVFMAGIAGASSNALDRLRGGRARQTPVEIEVIALNQRWLFVYPQHGVASVNQLTVPEGTPIHFRLTSVGILNRLFLPQLGSQSDSAALLTGQSYRPVAEIAAYRQSPAQARTDGDSNMHLTLTAISPEEFQLWVKRTRASGGDLNPATLTNLLTPTQAVVEGPRDRSVSGLKTSQRRSVSF